MSDCLQPHRQQPTRLPRPWDSPGKNTGVGYHFLLQCTKVKSQSEVAQSCLTPRDPMDCSLPGSSVHWIFQARVLEWDAIAYNPSLMRTLGSTGTFEPHCLFGNLGNQWEKAMAPHSSTLAWKIQWTEEPGGLQSIGSLRVGYDWGTSLSLFTFMHWRRKWQPTPVFSPGESEGRGSLVGSVYGAAQSWTRLKRLSSSSSSSIAFSTWGVL